MERVIEGKNPVLEALSAGTTLNKIFLARSKHRDPTLDEIIRLARQQHVPFFFTERKRLDKLSATGSHQGVVAFAAAKDYREVSDILEIARKKKEVPFLAMLDGIEDPHNLGAILRSAEAFGVHGVIIPRHRAAPLTSTVAKASAGAIEHIPVARVSNLVQTAEELKQERIWLVGVEAAGKQPLYKADFKEPLCLVIGGEGKGIRRLLKVTCDYQVTIPLTGKITSLNASVAAGIVFAEVCRQRIGAVL